MSRNIRFWFVGLSIMLAVLLVTACTPAPSEPAPTETAAVPLVSTCPIGNPPDNSDERVTYYTDLLAEYPGCLNALRDRALAYREIAEYELALADYTAALRQDDAVTYRDRAYVYRLLGDSASLESAVSDYERAIELGLSDTATSEAYHDLGYTYFLLRDYQEAISNYDQAIELDDSNPQYYVDRANAYAELGKLDTPDAEDAVEMALSDYCTAETLFDPDPLPTYASDYIADQDHECP